MRETIWEYIIPSSEEKSALWDRCTFVFDTNVLLNLYRYTSSTRAILLTALENLKDRVWLPHQVAYEYGKNRCDVIFETVEKYKAIEKSEQDFIEKVITELRLKATDKSVEELKASINNWLDEQKKINLLVTQASDDKILTSILAIFENRVGKPFSEEKLAEISKEGKERYAKQIPPGFCDEKKENDFVDNNAYGDLIVWKQIMEYASENHRDIIFVTHDQKKDWWTISKGRTVGPRVELRKEFSKITGQFFYMYSMESFLEQYSSRKGQTADKNALEEVLHIDTRKKKYGSKKATTLFEYSLVLEGNIISLQERIGRRKRAINRIMTKYQGEAMPHDIAVQLKNTEINLAQLEKQLYNKEQELKHCRTQISLNSIT